MFDGLVAWAGNTFVLLGTYFHNNMALTIVVTIVGLVVLAALLRFEGK